MSSWARRTWPGRLAHVDALGAGGRQVEQRRLRQPVVDDDVGPAQHVERPHGQQPRVARPGAHQVDGHGSPARARRGAALVVEQVAGQRRARGPGRPPAAPDTLVAHDRGAVGGGEQAPDGQAASAPAATVA